MRAYVGLLLALTSWASGQAISEMDLPDWLASPGCTNCQASWESEVRIPQDAVPDEQNPPPTRFYWQGRMSYAGETASRTAVLGAAPRGRISARGAFGNGISVLRAKPRIGRLSVTRVLRNPCPECPQNSQVRTANQPYLFTEILMSIDQNVVNVGAQAGGESSIGLVYTTLTEANHLLLVRDLFVRNGTVLASSTSGGWSLGGQVGFGSDGFSGAIQGGYQHGSGTALTPGSPLGPVPGETLHQAPQASRAVKFAVREQLLVTGRLVNLFAHVEGNNHNNWPTSSASNVSAEYRVTKSDPNFVLDVYTRRRPGTTTTYPIPPAPPSSGGVTGGGTGGLGGATGGTTGPVPPEPLPPSDDYLGPEWQELLGLGELEHWLGDPELWWPLPQLLRWLLR
jgi:hypothetical protein